ncbi:MAG TPA: agmatine deiminase family protein [Marinilabiliaceae bacterium]|nr:agmatine deiminase family protein [Marinilabiliaceae bacterium]
MINDENTNKLYLADTLPEKYPAFCKEFSELLNKCGINHELLKGTRDIWARDYMPIQVGKNKFVKFRYTPDYLNYKKYQNTISDVNTIWKQIDNLLEESDIVLDGGNVVHRNNKAILCDKIFKENPNYSRKELISNLRKLLKVDQLILVPQQPSDFIGHADGMVRFLNDSTVIINDYSKEKEHFQRAFKLALDNAGLDYIEIPYNPYKNDKAIQANGIYINYLQVGENIIVPTFDKDEDKEVLSIFYELFPNASIHSINSNEIANEGGVLNCISWNIEE